jgi:hypothetical protein
MAELQQVDIVGNYLGNYNQAQDRGMKQADRQRNMQRQDKQDQYEEVARKAEYLARAVTGLNTEADWNTQGPGIMQRLKIDGPLPPFSRKQDILNQALSVKDQIELARKGEQGGPFAGTGFEASSANILTQGQNDVSVRSSPQYAIAYGERMKPQVIRTADGSQVLFTPPPIPGILPPIIPGQAPQGARALAQAPLGQPGQRPPQRGYGAPQPPPTPDGKPYFDPASPPPVSNTDLGTGTVSQIPGSQAAPVPAEVAARLGLARGFLENYPAIIAKLDNVGTAKGRLQQFFNTGEVGEIVRQIESGSDALQRQLTGAGMSIPEAKNYASRYLPSPLDQPFDTLSKLKGLKYDLEHTSEAVMAGRGGFKSPVPSGQEKAPIDTKGWKFERVK